MILGIHEQSKAEGLVVATVSKGHEFRFKSPHPEVTSGSMGKTVEYYTRQTGETRTTRVELVIVAQNLSKDGTHVQHLLYATPTRENLTPTWNLAVTSALYRKALMSAGLDPIHVWGGMNMVANYPTKVMVVRDYDPLVEREEGNKGWVVRLPEFQRYVEKLLQQRHAFLNSLWVYSAYNPIVSWGYHIEVSDLDPRVFTPSRILRGDLVEVRYNLDTNRVIEIIDANTKLPMDEVITSVSPQKRTLRIGQQITVDDTWMPLL